MRGRPVWRSPVAWTIATLLGISAAISLWRLDRLGWNTGFLLPQIVHDIELDQQVDGHGEGVRLQTYLPLNDSRQTVLSERDEAGGFALHTQVAQGGRLAVWTAPAFNGHQTLRHRVRVRTEGVRFDLSPDFRLPDVPPAGVPPETLAPTDAVQSTSPEILALARELRPKDGSLVGFLRAVFDRVQGFEYKPFKGTTDALTALRLGEASCNGRARLFVALCRSQGIPARLVGGLVLTPGSKKTSHQWLEVWVAGHWVPMDPTNHHFAELPYNYLTLYRGDRALFRHSRDIGYRYLFRIDRRMVPRQQTDANRRALGALGLWGVFEKLGIPLDLLKVIIMIPVAALIVVIFRNVLGIRTFGTFLPALIAAAATRTGFVWGALAFLGLIAFVSLVRRLTARLELLHSPQLGVLLTTVVGAMLLTGALAASIGDASLGRVALFPIAILAITSERFVILQLEEGQREAWAVMARTLLVVFVCYVAMRSLSLQILMLAFPELLLVLIALQIWLGRWMGLRMTEWLRFKSLILRPRAAQPSDQAVAP